MADSKIQTFYANKTVLITGATGFMGKVLVEKLLRSCPDLKQIVLIVRDKHNLTANQRVAEYFKDSIFSEIRKKNSDITTKLKGYKGSLAAEDLDVTDEELGVLIEEVNIIFHMAATVNFAQNLRDAVAINIQGTKNVYNLAKKIKNLSAFIHVSTAYSNCDKSHIEEKIYQSPISVEGVQSLVECVDEKALNIITPVIMGEYPNTYVFTKNIAESIFAANKGDLPVGIFRPSIVSSCYEEPMPGWISNYNGAAAIAVGIMTGLCKVIRGCMNVNSHMVPVDMAINCLIASAWDVATNQKNQLPIYNYTSDSNPCKWDFLAKSLDNNKYPLECASFPAWYFTTSVSMPIYKTLLVLFHNIPAKIMDLLIKIRGKKPVLSRSYSKLNSVLIMQSYFILRSWKFSSQNVESLWKKLSSADQDIFNFDIKSVDWKTYLDNYMKGLKVYLLKEDMGNIENAKTKRLKIHRLQNVFNFICFLVVSSLFFKGMFGMLY